MGTEADPARARAADVPYLVGDRRKISVEIGWKPTRSLADTLEAVLEDWLGRATAARLAGERAG
jgi:GDP-D-mannose dehydratase